ncbi:MAG: hypothetical protein K0Q57_1179, partial [Gammaproteobacteria bacterium]|nr:hypothetical protein [Gammaproteobacteria bacterium]
MVKDYAKLNSQSLKATVVAASKQSPKDQGKPTARQPAESKPLPIMAAILTALLAIAIIFGLTMAYKHRDTLMATKEKIALFVGKFRHHSAQDEAMQSAGRLGIDQSLSDPTQSMAADNAQQTLNLPANVNLNAPVQAPPKKKPKPAAPQAPQPVFDFYTVLPSGAANSPSSSNSSGGASQPVPPPVTTPANSQAAAKFVVDIGYYQDQQSANQMRSQLILQGYTPTIKT